jgi:hypothetical protein
MQCLGAWFKGGNDAKVAEMQATLHNREEPVLVLWSWLSDACGPIE